MGNIKRAKSRLNKKACYPAQYDEYQEGTANIKKPPENHPITARLLAHSGSTRKALSRWAAAAWLDVESWALITDHAAFLLVTMYKPRD